MFCWLFFCVWFGGFGLWFFLFVLGWGLFVFENVCLFVCFPPLTFVCVFWIQSISGAYLVQGWCIAWRYERNNPSEASEICRDYAHYLPHTFMAPPLPAYKRVGKEITECMGYHYVCSLQKVKLLISSMSNCTPA